jgi:hypothetical protein
MELTKGDLRAALLLRSILDCMAAAKAHHNGHAWIAKSAVG